MSRNVIPLPSDGAHVALDQLRGYYVRSPRWVQSASGRLLSALPPRLLYGRTFRELQADIERSEWDAGFVERRVRTQLAALWSQARKAPYYARRIEDLAVDSPTLADLARLPILKKDEVRQGVDDMLAVPKAELDEVTTGGTSSGVPLVFYLDRDRSVKEWSFITHVWRRCGYELGDRLAVLGYRGVTHVSSAHTKPWAWEPGTRELRLSPFRMIPPVMDEYLEQLGRFRISIHLWLRFRDHDPGRPRPQRRLVSSVHAQGILLMSESVRSFQREIIGQGFGPIPVLAGYGLSEKVAIAGELPDLPDVYEFEPLYGVTELVDSDDSHNRPWAAGPGRIGTGFIAMGMPMIRYDTGDVATAVAFPSAQNCWRLRVRDIVSRYSQEYLVTREGGLVTRVVLNLYSQVASEFQFVEHEPGIAVMRVVPELGADRRQLDAFVRGINEQADGAISVQLGIVDAIPLSPRGKRVSRAAHRPVSIRT